MSKYYKIPLTERVVGVSTGSLYKTLRENYPDLYNREVGRMDLKYGDSKHTTDKDTMDRYNKETSMMYKAMGLPEFIIAVETVSGEGIKEISTSTPLIISSKEILKSRNVSKETAILYITEEKEYSEKIANFFTRRNQKNLCKRVEQ